MSHAKDELRQSLLELHYDLLDDGEANRLREAIQSDPEVAALWAETLRLAGKFADAARKEVEKSPDLKVRTLIDAEPSGNGKVGPSDRVDQPIVAELVEVGPASEAEQRVAGDPSETSETMYSLGSDRSQDGSGVVEPAKPTEKVKVPGTKRRSRWWLRSGLLAVTAAAIGGLVIGSWYLDRLPEAPSPALRLQAQAVPGDRAQADNEYRFVTSRVDGSTSAGALPVTPASLSFSVLVHGSVLFSGTTQTDRDGTGLVRLPSELAIPEGAELRVTAESPDGSLQQSTLKVPLEPTRCLTFLTVDRPVYRPGETVYFRSLTLQRRSLRGGFDVPVRFELIDPSGAIVPGAEIEGVTDRGVGNGSFTLPSAAAGGSYTLVAKSLDGFFPDESRPIQVRAYRVPSFKKELDFRRRSYGPGETVEAEFLAERAEGGALDRVALRVTAIVDERVVHEETTTTTADGTCLISFELPEHISQGVGTLSVAIDDGGTQETQSKTIPIQLGRVLVDFYPEGGYLIDGLLNRVYFAARNNLGDPIEVSGEILSRSGQSVATVATVRDGMGRFEFVPKIGERYILKVAEPVDVINNPRLPSVVKDLPVIDTGSGVFPDGEPISLALRSATSREVIVRAVCRGQLVGQEGLRLRPGQRDVTVPIRKDAGGVIRVTVIDSETGHPLVERLVYRRQDKGLTVEVVQNESELQRSPGEPLRLSLQVRDESGQPVPAVLGVSVVDDAALSLEENERPTLRTHFMLTSEVRDPEDLEHANFYLSDEPGAAESLDLLLGTQGWRRFVSGSATQPDVDFRQQLIRLLEMDGDDVASSPATFDSSRSSLRRWDEYRVAAASAWSKLIVEARLLMVAVLLIWLASVIVRFRSRAPSQAASWLLIATVSAFLYGCGAQEASVVATSDSVDHASEAAVANQMFDAEEEAEMAAESDSVPAMEAPTDQDVEVMSPPAENADVGDESGGAPAESETPPASTRPRGRPMVRAAEWGDESRYRQRELAVIEQNLPRSISREDLERLLSARGLDAETLADQLLDELRFPVRQYAHRYRKAEDESRQDFAETLYWQPLLVTDSAGKATIRFDLSDSVTSFRVNVDGHSVDGRIGSGDGIVTSRLPFQIEPKLPLEVTTGDRIDLPIAVINATDRDLGVELSLTTDQSLRPVGETSSQLRLSADQRSRAHVTLQVVDGGAEVDSLVQIEGIAEGSLSDTVRRSLHVSPAGYPARRSIAGVLNKRVSVKLPIPPEIVDGSLAVTVRAYPSPLADVMSGVEGILREPHGCFEQTSATNYPNAMALAYMQENEIANPEVSRRARGMLDRGYAKLISFECERLGYEWFGSDPGHEALSAFGLMQFNDMARIMDVSQEMVARTRTWLMGRRDGKGGFRRNPRHLHVWSVQQPIVNAYVLWALTEADVAAGQDHRAARDLGPELDEMTRVARQSDDPYLIALSAATLLNVKRTVDGEELLQKLAGHQAEDGSLTGKTTVVSSGGLSLKMETTALATLAWLKDQRFRTSARRATKWITLNRQGNSGFGSTQATVLALKALVAMSEYSQAAAGGDLTVSLHGEAIGRVALPTQPEAGSAVEIKGLGTHLQDARDGVELELVAPDCERLSYTIDLSYHVITPDSHDDCPLNLSTELIGDFDSGGAVDAADTLRVKAVMTNVTDSGQPMSVAIVGLPGGLEPRVEDLDELQQAGEFDYYELRGREVVLYWRTIEPHAVKQVEFTVTAEIPGVYTGPASRAYLYYTAEQKHWIEPLKVEIAR